MEVSSASGDAANDTCSGGRPVMSMPSVVAGLGCMPVFGRCLDRGARSAAVAASMLVRVIGTVLLLATPAGHAATGWLFAVAALFLGIGGQAVSAAHAA